MVKQLLNTFPNDVKVVFKHYPLSFHNNAKRAAIAAVAAQKQNKFWEYHDLLFANQRALDDASLRRYAQSLGLDLAAYDAAIRDAAVTGRVDAETKHALQAGVRGTPSFFVNGVNAPSWDFNTLKKLVETARSGGDVSKAAGEALAAIRSRQANAKKQRPQIDYNKVYDIDTAGAPSKGPAKASVVIVGFSDYQ